nr:putative transcriptional regulatory protein [Quercus suber]
MAPSRGFLKSVYRLSWIQQNSYVCANCVARCFVTSPAGASGHNRWSKIKHDKAKVDATKNRQRSIFAAELALASKTAGSDPNFNPRLADLITKAKREGFAKSSIEAAIARGQGRSLDGKALENITIEAIFPGNVGVIVECETDHKLRTLQDVRLVISKNGGTVSPVSFLFEKKGKITLESKEGVGVEEALEAAVEAGALDVDEGEDGRLVVSTEVESTKSVGEAMSNSLGVEIAMSEIVWEPVQDTMIGLSSEEAAQELCTFVDAVLDDPGVQGVSMNVAQGELDTDSWKELQTRLHM